MQIKHVCMWTCWTESENRLQTTEFAGFTWSKKHQTTSCWGYVGVCKLQLQFTHKTFTMNEGVYVCVKGVLIINHKQRERCCLVPFQSHGHQTGQRPRTGRSFWDKTLSDRLPEMSGYSSGTETKNKKREKFALLNQLRACLLKWSCWFKFGSHWSRVIESLHCEPL